jgi:signal transduction histidine kinase
VADDGSVIDAQTQERMFDAFFTTKGIGGSGLGLWISAEIMERHQGRIRIREQPAGGLQRHGGRLVFAVSDDTAGGRLPSLVSVKTLPQATMADG